MSPSYQSGPSLKISSVTITPVAFADPPLLNAVGVHEPFALRAVVEVATDAGLTGLGETYADEHHLAALRAVAHAVEGVDAYHTEELYRRVADVVGRGGHAIASGTVGDTPAADPVFAPFEMACLDIQGKAAGRPVADLLGGAVRDAVPFSAYLYMCEIAFEHLPPAIAAGAVQVVLADPHYWGGLRRAKLLAGICQTFGLGVSMHSDPHLGISLAAMTQLAAATPNLDYACDTHFPWRREDVIAGSPLTFSGGSIRVPDAPGLGVELDSDALGALHEQYLRCGVRQRDDTGYMRTIDPSYHHLRPRW